MRKVYYDCCSAERRRKVLVCYVVKLALEAGRDTPSSFENDLAFRI